MRSPEGTYRAIDAPGNCACRKGAHAKRGLTFRRRNEERDPALGCCAPTHVAISSRGKPWPPLNEQARSYWIGTTPRTDFPPVSPGLAADVVVVGAGIVGIT